MYYSICCDKFDYGNFYGYCENCNYCDYCNSCSHSEDCKNCNDCNDCDCCSYCNFCDTCNTCNYCNNCYSCNYCTNCNSSDLYDDYTFYKPKYSNTYLPCNYKCNSSSLCKTNNCNLNSSNCSSYCIYPSLYDSNYHNPLIPYKNTYSNFSSLYYPNYNNSKECWPSNSFTCSSANQSKYDDTISSWKSTYYSCPYLRGEKCNNSSKFNTPNSYETYNSDTYNYIPYQSNDCTYNKLCEPDFCSYTTSCNSKCYNKDIPFDSQCTDNLNEINNSYTNTSDCTCNLNSLNQNSSDYNFDSKNCCHNEMCNIYKSLPNKPRSCNESNRLNTKTYNHIPNSKDQSCNYYTNNSCNHYSNNKSSTCSSKKLKCCCDSYKNTCSNSCLPSKVNTSKFGNPAKVRSYDFCDPYKSTVSKDYSIDYPCSPTNCKCSTSDSINNYNNNLSDGLKLYPDEPIQPCNSNPYNSCANYKQCECMSFNNSNSYNDNLYKNFNSHEVTSNFNNSCLPYNINPSDCLYESFIHLSPNKPCNSDYKSINSSH